MPLRDIKKTNRRRVVPPYVHIAQTQKISQTTRTAAIKVMAKRNIFEKVLSILPRAKLDEYARVYCNVERPWHMTRPFLITALLAQEKNQELRNDMVKYISNVL